MAGQLINRGDRTWLVRIYLGRDVLTGKRKYHNKTIRGNKKDAQRYLTGILREMDLGKFCEPKKMTLNNFLDKWLTDAVKPRVRERTWYSYADALRCYVEDGLGRKQLSTVTALEIQSLYAALQERGLSVLTVRRLNAILGSAFKQAVKWSLIGTNPMTGVELPKDRNSRPEEKMKVLPLDRIAEFLEAALCSRWGIVFALALATGMRPGEYLALKWTDLDVVRKVIRVQRTLYRVKGGKDWSFQEPKTKGSVRSIALPEQLVEDLLEYRATQEARFGGAQELMFANDNGDPLFDYNLRKRHFKPLIQELAMDSSLHLYSLRHTHATMLLSAGIHPKLVADRMGHASVRMTLDVYSHVVPAMQSEVAGQVGDLLYGKDE